MITPELLALIICPACGGKLETRGRTDALFCLKCGNRYPVDGDIPVLIAANATRDRSNDTTPDVR